MAAITFATVYGIERTAEQRSKAEVREYASSIASALDRRGNSFSSYLRAGAALFSTIEEVDPQTFRQFVAELRLDQNYRGAEGIGWASVIERRDREEFLGRVRVNQPAFPMIRPAGEAAADSLPGAMMAPVTFFSPDTSRNRRALGFDMYSEPARAEAMHEAKRTVMPVASGKIVLAQEGSASPNANAIGEAPGFVIVMPVYKPVPGSAAQARELAGFVFSAFDAGKFLDAAIERAAPAELGVRLYDGGSLDEGDEVAEGDASGAQLGNLLVSRSLGEAGTDTFQQPVRIANREFVLVVDSRGSVQLGALSMVTLVAGLALASLLMLVLRLLAAQAIEDRTRLAFYEEQLAIRNSLSRELNHRVKNALANVLSIMSLTRRRASDLDSFAASLEGRVRALSATHDLLAETEWGTVPIEAVIEAETSHFAETNSANVQVNGPAVQLAPNDALSFGLAIHELTTNAAKYGALSVPGGSVSVSWELQSDDLAVVEWTEMGGPEVSETRKSGFGTDLIEKIVAHELRNRVDLKFLPGGVRCVMGVPVRMRGEFQIRETAPPTA